MSDMFEHGITAYSSEARQELNFKWIAARERLAVTFTAEQGGGYPPCLEKLSAKARLVRLKSLGFRVLRRWETDNRARPNDAPELHQWAALSGGICVNLTDGWVAAEVKS